MPPRFRPRLMKRLQKSSGGGGGGAILTKIALSKLHCFIGKFATGYSKRMNKSTFELENFMLKLTIPATRKELN